MNGTATMEYISGTVDSISFSEIGFYAAATAVTLLSWTTRAATSDPPAVSTPALLSGVYVVGLSYRKLASLLFCPLNIALPAVQMCAVLPPLFIKVWDFCVVACGTQYFYKVSLLVDCLLHDRR